MSFLVILCGILTLSGCGAHSQSIQKLPAANTFLPIEGQPYSVALADFDRDGILDAAVVVKYRGIYIFFGQESGGLDPNPLMLAELEFFGTGIDTGDFNGDGIPDIVYISETKILILTNDGTGRHYDLAVLLDAPRFGFNLKAADLNRDGITDIVAVGMEDNNVFIYTSTAPLRFKLTKLPLISNPEQTRFFAKTLSIGDVNGDGYPDILIPEFANSALWLIKNDRGGGFIPSLIAAPPPTQKITHAQLLFYDKENSTSYIGTVSGTYNPEFSIISIGNDGRASVINKIPLQLESPQHIETIAAHERQALLVITHYKAVTLLDADLNSMTIRDTLPISEPFDSNGMMSRYIADINAVITVCQKRDGIAVFPLSFQQ
jgi:hypothetical protein